MKLEIIQKFLITNKIFLITLFIFLIFGPLVSLPFIIYGICNDKENFNFYLFFISIFLGYIAYNFEPLIVDDLFRHYESMNHLSQLNIFEAIFKDMNILNNLIFYILGKFNIERLYPVIGTIITYYLGMLSITKVLKKSNFSNLQIILIIILSLVLWPFRLVTSGIRNFVVISIIVYWFFAREEKLLQASSILIIVACFFIHAYTIIFVFFYCCYKFIPKKYYVNVFIVFILSILIFDLIGPYLVNIPIIGYYISKFLAYRNAPLDYDFFSFIYIVGRIFFLIFTLFYAIYTKKVSKQFILLIGITIISLILNSRTFSERNMVFVAIVTFLLLIKNMNISIKIKKINTLILLTCILFFSALNYPTIRNYPLNQPICKICNTGLIQIIFFD